MTPVEKCFSLKKTKEKTNWTQIIMLKVLLIVGETANSWILIPIWILLSNSTDD